jgi:hypothetical protein
MGFSGVREKQGKKMHHLDLHGLVLALHALLVQYGKAACLAWLCALQLTGSCIAAAASRIIGGVRSLLESYAYAVRGTGVY